MGSSSVARLRALATLFVLLFAAAHLFHAAKSDELCNGGYFATLTIWTLVATAYALVAGGPPALLAAALAVNALVCALYYGVVNQGAVTGTSFLLHGGCALVLAALVACGALRAEGSPAAAAAAALGFLLANALLQCWHEGRVQAPLYPSAGRRFQHPLWRLAVLPLVGAAAAAGLAAAL